MVIFLFVFLVHNVRVTIGIVKAKYMTVREKEVKNERKVHSQIPILKNFSQNNLFNHKDLVEILKFTITYQNKT